MDVASGALGGCWLHALFSLLSSMVACAKVLDGAGQPITARPMAGVFEVTARMLPSLLEERQARGHRSQGGGN